MAAPGRAGAGGAAKAAKLVKGKVKGRTLSQLRKSEGFAAAGLTAAKAVGAGKGELRKLEQKLATIRKTIAAEEG